MIDPYGEMLESSWENLATIMANATNASSLLQILDDIIATHKIDLSMSAKVIYARDTRPSGERLVSALKSGLEAIGTESTDYGRLTTPQLHYLVRALNTKNSKDPYGEPTEMGYYKKLKEAFVELMVCISYVKPL